VNRHLLLVLAAATLSILGCETVSKITTSMAVSSGTMTQQQADAITKTAAATDKAMQKFTPEQEYYLGRSVAATVLTQYQPFDKAKATDYLNLVGQTLALASDKPDTFAGYHFLILDSDEVNAIAAPSGFILVTRGLLRCCKTEDQLAAVLAHEVAHIQLEHGIHAISSSRWRTAGMTAVLEGGKSFGGQQLSEVVGTFHDCVNDIATKAMNSGYARGQEFAADKTAVAILARVGYSPAALADMLQQLGLRTKPEDTRGFGKTHPPPQARLKELGAQPSTAVNDARTARFRKAMIGV
jgi:beta-barrel assembly-enhancing protease